MLQASATTVVAALTVAVSAFAFLLVGYLATVLTHSDAVGGAVWLGGTAAVSWWAIASYRRRSAARRALADARRQDATQRRSAERDIDRLRYEDDELLAALEKRMTLLKRRSDADGPGSVSGPAHFAVDRVASAARTAALQRYLATHVLDSDGAFICSSAHSCKTSAQRRPDTAFLEAQGHSVGPAYDLVTETGRPFRVLVIPMEVGGSNPDNHHRTLSQRTDDILGAGRKPFRARNPHMKGVTFALRLAFGLPVDDEDAEYLQFADGTAAQLFSCFAMANLLMCSAVATGTMSSRSTSVMRANCSRHMLATIESLQPTLVISQGAGLDKPLRTAFDVTRVHTPNLSECEVGGNRFVWASLHHPTRNWSALTHPYLHSTVIPTIEQARTRALAIG